jgi:hypothetical protein
MTSSSLVSVLKNLALGLSFTATLLSIFFSIWALTEAEVKVGPLIGVILFQGISIFAVGLLIFFCMKKRHTERELEILEEEDGN